MDKICDFLHKKAKMRALAADAVISMQIELVSIIVQSFGVPPNSAMAIRYVYAAQRV